MSIYKSKRPSLPGSSAIPLSLKQAFTIVEVMVSMAILLTMMLVITEVISQAQRSWKSASSRLSQFREARQAFDTITHGLRQAVINDYYGYTYGGISVRNRAPISSNDPPNDNHQKFAECAFVTNHTSTLFPTFGSAVELPGDAVLFQGPFGLVGNAVNRPLTNALCARGYYVKFGDGKESLPKGLSERLQYKYRYRLYELRQTTEANQIYTGDFSSNTPSHWKTIQNPTVGGQAAGGGAPAANGTTIQPIATNIIGLVFAPLFGGGTAGGGGGGLTSLDKKLKSENITYAYDTDDLGLASRYLYLPRAIRVVAFAIDEESAVKLAETNGNSCPNLLGKSGAAFTTPIQMEKDLDTFRESMNRLKINYRVFTATVPIFAGDWEQ